MNEYNFLFIWVMIFAVLQRSVEMKKPVLVMGEVKIRWMIPFALIVFFPIFHLAAFGTPIGDIPGYIGGYHLLPETWGELSTQISHISSGIGFRALTGIIHFLSDDSEKAFRIIIALIQCIPIIFLFREYSEDYIMSIFLFIATASHIAWLMNGMRQFVAAAIIYMATPFLLRRKYIPVVIMILLATTIHSSALIMLPVSFIVTGRAWNKRTLLYIAAAIVAAYFFSRNIGLADEFVAGTEYANTFSYYQKAGDDGVNPIRVLVYAVPPLLALLGRKVVAQDVDPVANLCINMSIVTVGLYLIGMVTNGIMVGRLPAYTSLYTLVLLPYLVNRIFTKDSQMFVTLIMIVSFLLFYQHSWGV